MNVGLHYPAPGFAHSKMLPPVGDRVLHHRPVSPTRECSHKMLREEDGRVDKADIRCTSLLNRNETEIKVSINSTNHNSICRSIEF